MTEEQLAKRCTCRYVPQPGGPSKFFPTDVPCPVHVSERGETS